jgi:glycosyltransferase involved in cell wall biosynthesis
MNKTMNLSPVVLFVYNRPQHTIKTIEALCKNDLSCYTELFIYCDGPKSAEDKKNVELVRHIVRGFEHKFRKVNIIERDYNYGLAKSIIDGVDDIINIYSKVIVLEDDIICSPKFLTYMNNALNHYELDEKVFSITAHTFPTHVLHIPKDYRYDTYASPRCSSWSWGTWQDRWKRIDWDMKYFTKFYGSYLKRYFFNRGGADLSAMLKSQYHNEIDSWAIRFCYAHYEAKMNCIYPIHTLVMNVGLDNSGTHSNPNPKYTHNVIFRDWQPNKFCAGKNINSKIQYSFRSIFSPDKSIIEIIINKLPFVNPLKNKFTKGCLFCKSIYPKKIDFDVIIMNTSQISGGAAKATDRLYRKLRLIGVNCAYVTLFCDDYKDDNTYGVTTSSLLGKFAIKFCSLERYLIFLITKARNIPYSMNLFANPLTPNILSFNFKIIHLNWISAGLMTVNSLEKITQPIVWTLHDAWAFTGGCYYPNQCNKYRSICSRCPIIYSLKDNDISYKQMKIKERIYESLDITVVSPSNWLAQMARESHLFGNKRIEVIPNGIDVNVFTSRDNQIFKKENNIPSDKKILLFGAAELSDLRKGGDLLFKILNQISTPSTLVVFGSGVIDSCFNPLIEVLHLGKITSEDKLVQVYSSADVFICPSREDNFPNTILEAMACGVTCAAFSVGGLPEMIDHKHNGWLAKPFDTHDLANGIDWLLNHKNLDRLKSNARAKVVNNFNIEIMASKYRELYNSLSNIRNI